MRIANVLAGFSLAEPTSPEGGGEKGQELIQQSCRFVTASPGTIGEASKT